MKNCVVIVRMNPTVALLPQESNVSYQGGDEDPPGFNAIFLPYADDFRDLSKQIETDRPSANKDQVDVAKTVINKLHLKNFKPQNQRNPVLVKHFNAVEAMALERENGPEEAPDSTKPDFDRIERKAGDVLREFRDAIFTPDYNPKRKGASGSGGGVKKPKLDEAPVDLEAEAKAGRLGKLTVASLKEQCTTSGIRLKATRKADIIAEINKHFGI